MSKKSFIEVTTTEGAMLLNTRKIKAIEQISNSNKCKITLNDGKTYTSHDEYQYFTAILKMK